MTARHLTNNELIMQMVEGGEIKHMNGTTYEVRYDTTLWTVEGPVNLKKGQTLFVRRGLAVVEVMGE